MSAVYAAMAGFAGYSGGAVFLNPGDEWDSEHPLVVERPNLFTSPEPEPEVVPEVPEEPEEPEVEAEVPEEPEVVPEVPVRRGPGRPPGSKNKPKPPADA